MRPLAAVLLAATILALAAAGARSAEPVRILWIQYLGAAPEAPGAGLPGEIAEATGLEVRLEVIREVPPMGGEALFLAEKAAYGGFDLVFGLTLADVDPLARNGLIGEVPLKALGPPRSRALYVSDPVRETPTRRAYDPDNVLAVPLEVSAPLVCYDREAAGHVEKFETSVELLAYGKLSQRLAMPDPRRDPVGRAVLLSAFAAAGGVREGWSLVEQLDRVVELYTPGAFEACRAVEEGRAEIGFTSLHFAELVRREPRLGLRPLAGGALVPIHFAAALSRKGAPPGDAAARVLRWVVEHHVGRQLDLIARRLAREGLDSDIHARAAPEGVYEYLPVEDLVGEWSARYDFRAQQMKR